MAPVVGIIVTTVLESRLQRLTSSYNSPGLREDTILRLFRLGDSECSWKVAQFSRRECSLDTTSPPDSPTHTREPLHHDDSGAHALHGELDVRGGRKSFLRRRCSADPLMPRRAPISSSRSSLLLASLQVSTVGLRGLWHRQTG